MTSRLQIAFSDDRPNEAILSGMISEDADFSDLVAAAHRAPLTLHLNEIARISSTGVREWILFMRAVDESEHSITLKQVAPTLVRQLNMIEGFGGAATIESVLLPYYCDSCGKEHSDVAQVNLGSTVHIAEARPCPHCGEEAEFDDLPGSYLAFLQGR